MALWNTSTTGDILVDAYRICHSIYYFHDCSGPFEIPEYVFLCKITLILLMSAMLVTQSTARLFLKLPFTQTAIPRSFVALRNSISSSVSYHNCVTPVKDDHNILCCTKKKILLDLRFYSDFFPEIFSVCICVKSHTF